MIRWEVPRESSLELELWGPQYSFVTDKARFTSFIAGIGSGKTVAGSVKTLVEATSDSSPKLGMVIAPTYPMLRDATIRTLLDVLGGCPGPILTRHFKSDGILLFRNGTEILLRSADQPDRLRGPTLHFIWIDEAALCPPQTLEISMGRLRAAGLAGPLWITGTPKGQNWVWQHRKLFRRYRARTADNPYVHRDFVRSLQDTYVGQFSEQELEGEFVLLEGLIYDEFREDGYFVRRRDLSEFVDIWGAGDEGYVNPQVFLVLGLDGDGGVHVIDEFYERKIRHTVAADEAQRLSAQYGFEDWYVDPSAAGLIGEMEERDLAVQHANNTVVAGIQSVKSFLAAETAKGPGLTIDPSCVWTLSEIQQYTWMDYKAGRPEKPVKSNDHAMDALRYGIYTRLGAGIGLQGKLVY